MTNPRSALGSSAVTRSIMVSAPPTNGSADSPTFGSSKNPHVQVAVGLYDINLVHIDSQPVGWVERQRNPLSFAETPSSTRRRKRRSARLAATKKLPPQIKFRR